MKVDFWGVRGSIAAPVSPAQVQAKVEEAVRLAVKAGITDGSQVEGFVKDLPWYVKGTAGGDSTCLELNAGEELLIFDGGSGLRKLGLNLMGRYKGAPIKANLLLSHTHWDHICGIPFFIPGFIPVNEITITGVHENLEGRIKGQQAPDYFPVPLGPAYKFRQVEYGQEFAIGEAKVKTIELLHPGKCTGYRVEHGGKVFVFATDAEYKDLSISAQRPFLEFFQDADLLVFDAQYTMLENVEKENWGHSNTMTGIDMALEAGVKKLAFTHHEPTYDDAKLEEIMEMAREYLEIHGGTMELVLAREGGSLEL